MPSDDLKGYATSSIDFYDLLGVSFETSQEEIKRAWRKTALKYHPDKVGPDPAAKEKFHLAQVGYDLLSDPSSKAIYDNARTARIQRQRQNELFEGRRRQMKDDLEARERGIKRPRDEYEGEEEKLEREIRRLAEDGKRRRKEREEALRRELQRDAEQSQMTPNSHTIQNLNNQPSTIGRPGVVEIDRTVKVRWPVDGEGGSLTAANIRKLFTKFGEIESADLLSPKMVRLNETKRKQMALTCMILYRSVVGAHAAVEDFHKQKEPQWQIFESVKWAANKEPEFLCGNTSSETQNSASPTPFAKGNTHPSDPPKRFSDPSSPASSPQLNGKNLHSKPSFTSFTTADRSTPKSSPFGKGLGPNSPSLEEMTMIRLRKLEQKRLAAEIEKQDREADAAKQIADEIPT